MSGYKFVCAYRKRAQCMNLRYVSVNVSPKYPGGESRRVGKTTCPAGPTDRQSPFSRASIQRASRHRGAAAWGGQVLASSSYKTDTTDSNMAGGLAATAGGWRDAAQWRGTAQCQLVPLQKEIRPFYWRPHVTYNSPLHTAQQANAFGHAGSSQKNNTNKMSEN